MIINSSRMIFPILLLNILQISANVNPYTRHSHRREQLKHWNQYYNLEDLSLTTPHMPAETIIVPTQTYPPIVQQNARIEYVDRYVPCEDPKIKLNLTRAGLKSVGVNFIENPKVTELYLVDNNIVHVSTLAFTLLPGLQILDMSGNNVTTSQLLLLGKLGRLRKLIIDNNKYKEEKSVVEQVSESLSSLEELSLRRSNIYSFSVDLRTSTPQLIRLDLSENKIESTEFLDQLPKHLSFLYMDDNLISEFKINTLQTIKELSVSGNKIEKLCAEDCKKSLTLKGAVRLQKLNASRNAINEVTGNTFASATRLVHLDLSVNKITMLPSETFERLLVLEELHLSRNQLTSIPNVCPLDKMSLLDLSGNQITAIVKESFCDRLRYLKTLLLANNQIVNVDNEAFTNVQSLRILDLSDNMIVTFPARLIAVSRSLEVLLLKNNNIAKLDELATVTSQLQELHLQGNPLMHLKASSISSRALPNLVIYLKEEKEVSKKTLTDEGSNTAKKLEEEEDYEEKSYSNNFWR